MCADGVILGRASTWCWPGSCVRAHQAVACKKCAVSSIGCAFNHQVLCAAVPGQAHDDRDLVITLRASSHADAMKPVGCTAVLHTDSVWAPATTDTASRAMSSQEVLTQEAWSMKISCSTLWQVWMYSIQCLRSS